MKKMASRCPVLGWPPVTSQLAAATVCPGGVRPAGNTVPDASVETGTAFAWECPYSGRGAKLKAVSLIFKEAALNFRKTQPKDVFTRLYIHSGHELGCSCQPGDEGYRKLLCRDAGCRGQEAACRVHGSLPPAHTHQAMP